MENRLQRLHDFLTGLRAGILIDEITEEKALLLYYISKVYLQEEYSGTEFRETAEKVADNVTSVLERILAEYQDKT